MFTQCLRWLSGTSLAESGTGWAARLPPKEGD
jgi:hypothetical protein